MVHSTAPSGVHPEALIVHASLARVCEVAALQSAPTQVEFDPGSPPTPPTGRPTRPVALVELVAQALDAAHA